jgi:plastocyanin
LNRIRIAVLAVLAALVVAVAAQAATKASVLTGTVGPGFTITLTQGGKKVTALKAGTYTIRVTDKSNIHNFHLTGPGVNKMTTVPFVGNQSWTLKLKKGTYKFVCDPHATLMKGSFKVS